MALAQLHLSVAKRSRWRYGAPVVTLLATSGFRSPRKQKAHKRPKTIAGALFLRPQCRSMVAVRGAPSGAPGSFCPGTANSRTATTNHRFAAAGDSSNQAKGAVPMQHIPARSPSTASTRAAAHRAMALAALRADSSLSVRLKRYNDQMAKARALEAQEVAL